MLNHGITSQLLAALVVFALATQVVVSQDNAAAECMPQLTDVYECTVNAAMENSYDSLPAFLNDTVLNAVGNCSLPFFGLVQCASIFNGSDASSMPTVTNETAISMFYECAMEQLPQLQTCAETNLPDFAECVDMMSDALECLADNPPTCDPRPEGLVLQAVCDEASCLSALAPVDACTSSKVGVQECISMSQTNTSSCLRERAAAVIDCAIETLPACTMYNATLQAAFENDDEIGMEMMS
mmetsp:Transcript_1250/g.3481  ORF Transcript_1250/g.3481 Transcript_1250/m.3481 type:complete len:241 (+) Transcript_1250:373-1095(+)|eukprot:CAMPEP_0185838550 /NCGR_PEP_ID=MMETSP1353-20130828/13205_1 /TAXON_ID=1077150 /ORGANISM="Erythrolobus australicus, Strain CCMP3124" /LENGTH=240 /DNA_ID=CAMNT_0028537623 /DNA_START=245 /DNA_END=967 /DNA_ORIENTATION=+